MNDLDQLQNKYLVLKWEDVNILSESRRRELENIILRIENWRQVEAKPRFNNYIVINTDEPYIQEIIDVMKKNGHWGK